MVCPACIRSKRSDAVNQMIAHSLVEDPLCHTDVSKENQLYNRMLIVDDEADVTITFKAGIEESNNDNGTDKRIEVYTSNNPIVAISEFKPDCSSIPRLYMTLYC